jgi:hypothetical protein
MHIYQRRWPDDSSDWPLLSPADFTFRDALDVVRFAEMDPLVTWRTWPDIWHLDSEGRWQCCSKGSSLDSLRRYAEAPQRLLDCRVTDVGRPCPDYWVVLEPRQQWRLDRPGVDEGDAQAFVELRRGLALHGVTLLDVVVFDDDSHWWSLHELTSGSTAWM